MFNVKCFISGAVAVALSMACAESALAHRMRQRVIDRETGQSFRVNVNHRHTRSGRVIVLDNDRSWRRGGSFSQNQGVTVVPASALGAPVVTYRTYTTSDPYFRGGHRYDDRNDGYRYYRDNDGSVLGRVLQGVVQGAVQGR